MEKQIDELKKEVSELKISVAVIEERTKVLDTLNAVLVKLNNRIAGNELGLEKIKNWTNTKIVAFVTFINGIFWTAFIIYAKFGDK